jgi:modification methylase
VTNGLLQDRADMVDFPVRQITIRRRKGGIYFNSYYFLPTCEMIYLIARPNFKIAPKADSHGDVWEFTQDKEKQSPAPFPINLPKRIIDL